MSRHAPESDPALQRRHLPSRAVPSKLGQSPLHHSRAIAHAPVAPPPRPPDPTLAAITLCCTAHAAPGPAGGAATVDGARIAAADSEPQNWLTHGRTYGEQRYSPLAQINDRQRRASSASPGRSPPATTRGLAGDADRRRRRDVHHRRVERRVRARRQDRQAAVEVRPEGAARVGPLAAAATSSTAASRSGRARSTSARSTAASSRSTRRPARSAGRSTPSTAPSPTRITGAPRVVKGKVLIGNGGAEIRRARLSLGLRRRRPASSPGASTPCPATRRTASSIPSSRRPRRPGTASGGSAAAAARCGTRWPTTRSSTCSTSAPATARRGTRDIRSPGGGDNLFLSSIVALDPDTGGLKWHYQTTPARTGTTPPRSTSSSPTWSIGGKPRKVLMQAPKNGFFYVLDRATGELLSADKFAPVTWASHVDLKTGRPVETEVANYSRETQLIVPGAARRAQLAPDGLQPEDGPRLHPGDAADVPVLAVVRLQEHRPVRAPRHVLESRHRLEPGARRHDGAHASSSAACCRPTAAT